MTVPFSFLNEVVSVQDFGILLRDLLNAIRSLISCSPCPVPPCLVYSPYPESSTFKVSTFSSERCASTRMLGDLLSS